MQPNSQDLHLRSYNYELPEDLIAQHPAKKRDKSRLMVINTVSGGLQHNRFEELEKYISEKDMLVVNATKVFPARLFGKKETGGKVEIFLLEYPRIDKQAASACTALVPALIKASKRPRENSTLRINDSLSCRVVEELGDGKVLLELHFDETLGLNSTLQSAGEVPLPPYIERKEGTTKKDTERYQTVYAEEPGAVAAPTAGLHFTEEMVKRITSSGCNWGSITLHVGYGTFAPVRTETITDHQIHSEYLTIPKKTVELINETKKRGGKIWAVGTTTVRGLEYGAQKTGELQPVNDWCDLYIYPGFQFRVIDNLITNFHLPSSSLMFLVSALCGRKTLLECYNEAVNKQYRFFSYGDAMAIITKPAT